MKRAANMGDLISRQEALDALSKLMPEPTSPEGGYDGDTQLECETLVGAMEIITDLPSANMGDLISRQAAINAANRTDYRGLAVEDVTKVTDAVVEELKRLPSAQPGQKKGKWIATSDEYGHYWSCSICGEELPRISLGKETWDCLYPTMVSIDKTDYCPNCGSRMTGE